jgi:hypothetical protein
MTNTIGLSRNRVKSSRGPMAFDTLTTFKPIDHREVRSNSERRDATYVADPVAISPASHR